MGYATLHGLKVRFDTQLISFSKDEVSNKIVSLVRDHLAGREYQLSPNTSSERTVEEALL